MYMHGITRKSHFATSLLAVWNDARLNASASLRPSRRSKAAWADCHFGCALPNTDSPRDVRFHRRSRRSSPRRLAISPLFLIRASVRVAVVRTLLFAAARRV